MLILSKRVTQILKINIKISILMESAKCCSFPDPVTNDKDCGGPKKHQKSPQQQVQNYSCGASLCTSGTSLLLYNITSSTDSKIPIRWCKGVSRGGIPHQRLPRSPQHHRNTIALFAIPLQKS